jgi:hypothetical protein
LNWDFLDLWKLENHELLEKVEGERSSRTIEQTYKHTRRMLGMEGDTYTLKEIQKDHCFAMHMSTSANQNTKKHLEELKEHLQIWKIPLCILFFFVEIIDHTTFMSKHLTKLKRKDLRYCQNALRNQTPYLDAWSAPQTIEKSMTNDNSKRKHY